MSEHKFAEGEYDPFDLPSIPDPLCLCCGGDGDTCVCFGCICSRCEKCEHHCDESWPSPCPEAGK